MTSKLSWLSVLDVAFTVVPLDNAKRVFQTACNNYNTSFRENNTPHAPMQKSIKEGSIVYVRHTQRGKLHIKLAQPFKGPYMCIKVLHNSNVALRPLDGGKVIHAHLNYCKIVPLRPDHLILNPLPMWPSPSHYTNSANDFRYSHHAAQLFECTDEDNAPTPPPAPDPPHSPSPARAHSPPPPHPTPSSASPTNTSSPPSAPAASPSGARPKARVGRPAGKKPLTASYKFRLRK